MYSRRLKVEEKENKRKAFGFVLLTVASILAMYFFGIPLIVRFSNFVYDLRKSSEPIESGDKTPPPPPRLSALPLFTKETNIEIQGTSEPGAKVTIFVNTADYEVLVNNDGEFTQTIELWDGENNIYLISTDQSGNESARTEEYKVTYDTKAPEVELITPKDGEEFYGVSGRQIKIEGKTEPDATVQINDRNAIVASDGKFDLTATLNDGDNRFVIKATDLARNQNESEFTVRYYR